MDLVPMFKGLLLSFGWVNEIIHVSQRFVGGAKDFRTALCKDAIEIGFEFVYVKNDKCWVTTVCAIKDIFTILLNGCLSKFMILWLNLTF